MKEPIKITARNDYAFKKLFAQEENKDIFIEFVSIITKINKDDFEQISLQNKETGKTYYDDKYGIVDVKARLKNGTKINIEMQNKYYNYYPKRNLYYWSKIYTQDIKQGYEYNKLNKTISINLLNERFPITDKLHSIFRLYEEQEHTLLDDTLEIHYLDMTKIDEKKEVENISELEKWLLFIQTDKKEVREMLSRENNTLKKADKVMDKFYSDDIEREMYLTAEKYEMDKYLMNLENYEKGMALGIQEGLTLGRQEGLSLGRQEGLNLGRQEGLSLGIDKRNKEIAIEMIKEGMPYHLISKLTGLDENTLKKL